MPAVQSMRRWRQDSQLTTQTQDQLDYIVRPHYKIKDLSFIWEETKKVEWKKMT